MELRSDIVVIGGGLSGVTAALRAAGLGREVILVRKGYGATAVGSGAFDVLGGEARGPFDIRAGERFDPKSSLSMLLKQRPAHPYGLFLDSDGAPDDVAWTGFRKAFDAAATFIEDRLGRVSYLLAGNVDSLAAHITSHGTLRWTNLSPLAVRGGDLSQCRKARVAFIGIDGVDAFDPSFVCRAVENLLGESGRSFIESTATRSIRLPWARASGGFKPSEVARDLDDPGRRETFVAEIEKALGGERFTHLIMAPVLGLASHSETLDLVESRTGVNVCEPLVPPPHAMHGLRLQKALDRALEASAVRVVSGRVTGVDAAGGLVREIQARGEDEPLRLRAAQFVLATGRFFGGGLVGRGAVREAIFDLPVFLAGKSRRDRPVFSLLRPDYWARQPAFEAGLRSSGDMRPVRADGQAAFDNLFVAGTILGGYDLARDGTAFGVDLMTGFEAGRRAAGGVG